MKSSAILLFLPQSVTQPCSLIFFKTVHITTALRNPLPLQKAPNRKSLPLRERRKRKNTERDSAHYKKSIKNCKNQKITLDKSRIIDYNHHAVSTGTAHGGIAQLVEHSVHTRSVICSSQIAATRPVGQAVKTPPFHGGNMGSSPVRVTKKKDPATPRGCRIFLCLQGVSGIPLFRMLRMKDKKIDVVTTFSEGKL